jgi:hypothetical protein
VTVTVGAGCAGRVLVAGAGCGVVAPGAGGAWWVTVAVTVWVGAFADWEVLPDEQAATTAKVPAAATATNTPFTSSA